MGESRNLGKLAAIVSNSSAVDTLKATGNLDMAYLFSDGQEKAFTKVLNDADKKLRDVFKLTSDIDDFTDSHFEQIEKLINLAEDIQTRIRRAIRRHKENNDD